MGPQECGDLNPELPGLLRKWAAGQTGTSESWPWMAPGAETAQGALSTDPF